MRAAAIICGIAMVATLALLPFAAAPLPVVPGFLALNQGALFLVYAITAWLFLAQYRSLGALPLLVLGAGNLFTTLMIALQLVCFPNMMAQGLILGQGAATLTWLWTFWHLGPPLCALVYALYDDAAEQVLSRRSSAWVGSITIAAIFAAVIAIGILTTQGVQWLPQVADANGGYRALTTSGIGPALLVLTVAAIIVLVWRTRLRSVLQIWLAASLFLLLLDNVITDVGAARATVGWYAGRVEALLAVLVLLGVYLFELDSLYRRAASAVAGRDRALRDVKSARDSLEIALDASGMGDWELDLASQRLRRTARYDRIFGLGDATAAWDQVQFLDHVLAEDRGLVEQAFDEARAGTPLALECRITRADDGAVRWIGLWGKTRFDHDGGPVALAGCVMDATDRRLTEERLREAERMEAIGQLTGGVAHDFNNLLTVILGSLDMISRRPDDPARVRRLAENAFTAGRRGTDLTEKLLSFSRRQVVNPKTVNLNRLLGEFRPLLQRAVGEAINVVIDLDPTLDPAKIDVGQFQAAVLNLAGNARDAMPGGGTFTIATRNVSVSGAEGGHPADPAPGDYLQVQVSDTGIGMDAATAARAFEPFFTTKEVGRGTGLGLSQVYGFARQAGGTCAVRSAPGQGCTIEFTLPRSRDEAERPETTATILPLRRAKGQEVVLIVEDEEAVRDMAAESLKTLGYRVLTAPDARVALNVIKGPSRIDILFSDVVMPGGMNGAQLAVQARAMRPALKVLLTSGYTTTATGGTRELPAGVPLLRKPYLREELASTLEAVLTVGVG